MRSQSASYHGYRFPPDIISHAVWLYHRFCPGARAGAPKREGEILFTVTYTMYGGRIITRRFGQRVDENRA